MTHLSNVTVYGSSDDLIEIEGDLREEFTYIEDGPNYLAFSNGLLLKIRYDEEGEWRILSLNKPRGISIEKIDSQGADSPNYSDVAMIYSDTYIDWVVHGKNLVR